MSKHSDAVRLVDAYLRESTSNSGVLVTPEVFEQIIEGYGEESGNLVTGLLTASSELGIRQEDISKLLSAYMMERLEVDAHKLNLLKDRPNTRKLR